MAMAGPSAQIRSTGAWPSHFRASTIHAAEPGQSKTSTGAACWNLPWNRRQPEFLLKPFPVASFSCANARTPGVRQPKDFSGFPIEQRRVALKLTNVCSYLFSGACFGCLRDPFADLTCRSAYNQVSRHRLLADNVLLRSLPEIAERPQLGATSVQCNGFNDFHRRFRWQDADETKARGI